MEHRFAIRLRQFRLVGQPHQFALGRADPEVLVGEIALKPADEAGRRTEFGPRQVELGVGRFHGKDVVPQLGGREKPVHGQGFAAIEHGEASFGDRDFGDPRALRFQERDIEKGKRERCVLAELQSVPRRVDE